MTKEQTYPFNIVDKYNEVLDKMGKRLRITEHEDERGFYAIEIVTDGRGATLFADNHYEDELSETAADAFIHAVIEAGRCKPNDETLRYVKVSGGKDGNAALISTLTDYPVYFHDDERDELLRIDNYPFKDKFEDSNGSYYVRADDYEDAMQKIED